MAVCKKGVMPTSQDLGGLNKIKHIKSLEERLIYTHHLRSAFSSTSFLSFFSISCSSFPFFPFSSTSPSSSAPSSFTLLVLSLLLCLSEYCPAQRNYLIESLASFSPPEIDFDLWSGPVSFRTDTVPVGKAGEHCSKAVVCNYCCCKSSPLSVLYGLRV